MKFDTAEHNEVFGSIVLAHVQQYGIAKNSFTRKKLREGLLVTLRKWTDMPVKMVSMSAQSLAEKKGVNLFEQLWGQRRCLDDKRTFDKRSNLVWEHTTPLADASISLLECGSAEEVQQWMSRYSGVCWITREEDDRLKREGYSKTRPGGWKDCYSECGIEVMAV